MSLLKWLFVICFKYYDDPTVRHETILEFLINCVKVKRRQLKLLCLHLVSYLSVGNGHLLLVLLIIKSLLLTRLKISVVPVWKTLHANFMQRQIEHKTWSDNHVCLCHRASWGSAVQCKTRGCIEIITITAVLFD